MCTALTEKIRMNKEIYVLIYQTKISQKFKNQFPEIKQNIIKHLIQKKELHDHSAQIQNI